METEEKNGTLENPEEWKGKGTKLTSVNIDVLLWENAKREGIGIKDALEFGIMFKIADKIGFDYPASNLNNKLQRTLKRLEEKSLELENYLSNKIELATEEADKFFEASK